MRLFRISNILFLGVATILGVMLFWTSQEVQKKEDELKQVRQKLSQEIETVRVLSVEWDYLNRPQRLEELAAEIGMEKATAKEMVRSAGDIPEPIIVRVDPNFPDESMAQAVSLEMPAAGSPAKAASARSIPMKAEIVAPSQAEKQSFDRLIESINAEGGQ